MVWYTINNADTIDTPALVLYKERILQNISEAAGMIKDINLLRPHVKTSKIAEVCVMLMQAGVSKFKCATIAEAEMLAMNKAKDVLLAYQPVGPKAERLLLLTEKYPATSFSCLVDDESAASKLSHLFSTAGKRIGVFIDLNTGMNRSGIYPAKAFLLFEQLQLLPGIVVKGLHAYDGHLNDTSIAERERSADEAFKEVPALAARMESKTGQSYTIVVGGSPTFPMHIKRKLECSPGTFVFWDWAYKNKFPDEPFDYAALVMTRVVSIVNEKMITTDLGHKSVAAENPLPRVYFLNATDLTPVGQSEEHLVLETNDSSQYKIGDVLYGVPVHICPTVALYDKATVVENNKAVGEWNVIARNRKITV